MPNSDSHFYLYGKDWYKKSDNIFDDLRLLLANYSDVPLSDITHWHVMDRLLQIVDIEVQKTVHIFYDFGRQILPQHTWEVGYYHTTDNHSNRFEISKVSNEYDVMYAMAYKCLHIMRHTNTSHIEGGLCRPDFNILPPAHEFIEKSIKSLGNWSE